MAFNPFLSMAEPAAPVAAELNPFMMGMEAEPEPALTADNPFAASNPFADFGGGGDFGGQSDFGGANTFGAGGDFGGGGMFESDPLPDIFGVASPPAAAAVPAVAPAPAPPPVKPTELPLRQPPRPPPPAPARPLPPETQTLLQSVTGHMELTSEHLLDRLPPTRTPSPVSARDLHSPEPDLPDLELDPPAPPAPPAAELFDINRNKPARPAPPTRPARPAPPPIARAASPNLFDAPAPAVVPPTKEAIMSLYSAPKPEEKQVDFLGDDFLEIGGAEDAVAPLTSVREPSSSLFSSEPAPAEPAVKRSPPEIQTAASPVLQAAAHPELQTVAHPELTPQETSPFAAAAPDAQPSFEPAAPMDCSEPPAVTSPFDDDHPQAYQPEEGVRNPFEDFALPANETAEAFMAQSTNIFGTAQNDAFGATNDTYDAMDAFNDSKPAPTPTAGFEEFSVNASPFPAPAPPAPAWGAPEPMHQESAPPAPAWGAPEPMHQESAPPAPAWGAPEPMHQDSAFPESQDAFDAFSAKFDSTGNQQVASGAWGDDSSGASAAAGFEAEAFDSFLSMSAPPPPPPAPAATPHLEEQDSRDSGDDTFSLFIRPKESAQGGAPVPALAPPPPPRPQALPDSPRANPFDEEQQQGYDQPPEAARSRSGSGGETPPTPLYDEDVSQPLEDFPRTKYVGSGWEMQLRQPNKKKITGQRFWKKIFVRLAYQGDNPVVQLLNSPTDKEPFQELPLQACYSVSEVGAQQFDQYGKIFTVKLQYVFYKERPGVRPGQVTKAERITNKLSQFAQYAIQGDYQGCKEFGSDLRKLGLPVEHAPQVSQLFKIGSLVYEDMKQFSCCVEEALFRLPAHRDRALTYKMEEVQITAVDELYVEQDADGAVQKQIARVRLFFLGFLSGMPDVELGVNDMRRQGKEVVGRHDIIPVVTEEWIRVEDTEFHACVQPEEFDATKIIKFKPPDACYIELMRFRVRPPKNRELPLQLKAVWCVTGNKVELRADVLVPGFASRKLGQIPCEDVSIRFPIPECWIYLFRVEKHFRYGSVKSAHRRTGKIKGIERFLGAVDTLQESLIEVTSGQAKYEHQHRAIVWRMPRLPKEGQGAYTTHNLVCRMALTSYDQIPAELAKHAFVEFTMPATQVSHMTVRSVSLQNYDNEPPEKYVRYLARHEYTVGIERTSGQEANPYAVVTRTEPRAEPPPPAPALAPVPPSDDSDSD